MITNYTELKSAVLSWVNHPEASGKEADFITLAEAEISADINVSAMRLEQSVAVVDGASSVAFPENVIDPFSFQVGGAQHPDVIIKPSESINRMIAGFEPYDATKFYGAIVGRSLKVYPFLSAGTVVIYAKCAIPSLSSSNATNWLLTAFPNVYLFAAIREAGAFLRDQQMIEWAEGRYRMAVDKVNAAYVYRGQMAAPVLRGIR